MMEELLEATKGGKRVRKTPQEKLAILEFLDAGGSAEDAAARFGIARNAVAKMLKEREDAAPETGSSSVPAAAATSSTLGKRARQAPTNEELAAFAQQPGASVAAAATKFGLTRAEVTRVLKEVAEDASTQSDAAAAALALVSSDVISADSVANASLAAGIDEQIAAVSGLTNAPLVLGSAEGIEGVVPVSSELTRLADRLAAADSSHTGDVEVDGRKTVRVTKEEKAAILQFVEQGGLPAAAAGKFGVSLAAVAKVIQEKADALVAITAAMASTAAAATDLQIAAASVTSTTATSTTTVVASEVGSNIMDVDSAASAAALPAASGSASSAMEIDSGAVVTVVDGSSTVTSATVTTSTTATVTASAGSSDVAMSATSTAVSPSEAVTTIASTTEAIAAPTAATVTTTTESGVPAMPAPTPTAARKGRRVRKTNSEKLEILAFVEKGGSQGAAAEKFGVSRTAVTKMVKEKDAICAQARSENTNSRKVLQYQHKLSIIEDMLYKWQLQVEIDSPSVKLTGDLLQSKAMEFRNKVLADYSSELPDEVVLSLTDFKASNGWLHRYMQRRSIRALPKHNDEGTAAAGTSASGDRTGAEQRIQRIRAQLTQVPASCIWTLSEVVLRHRTTSGRLDALINLDARAMDRVSAALAASASGEKLRLQVVGKDEHAASLLGGSGADAIDPVATYGIQFRAHTRAWHDSYAVVECIQQMNREAKARKQVWFLVLDSSASHVAAAHALHPSGSYRSGFTFESVVLLFLPPSVSVASATGSNSTRDMQPLCQGVVRDFKRTFRFEMLQSLMNARQAWLERMARQQSSSDNDGNSTGGGIAAGAVPTDGELFDVHAHTTIRHSLSWLQKAWEAVTPSDIRRAWSCCAFLPPQSDAKASDGAAPSTANGDNAVENGQASTSGSISVSTTGSVATSGQLRELLSNAAAIPQLVKDLGLDGLTDADSDEAVEAEVVDFDGGDSGAADELAKDDEIVIESLSLQGLLRDTPRALEDIAKDSASGGVGPEIASVGEACGTVARLLRFIMARGGSTTAQELLSPSDRRAARANLLALQRVLLKARAKEQEQEPAHEQEQEHDAATAYTV